MISGDVSRRQFLATIPGDNNKRYLCFQKHLELCLLATSDKEEGGSLSKNYGYCDLPRRFGDTFAAPLSCKSFLTSQATCFGLACLITCGKDVTAARGLAGLNKRPDIALASAGA